MHVCNVFACVLMWVNVCVAVYVCACVCDVYVCVCVHIISGKCSS